MQSSPTFNKKYFKKLPLRLVVLLIIFALAIFLFAFITYEVILEKKEAFDNHIFNYLSTYLINPRLTVFMKGVTHFASATFLEIAYGVLLVAYLIRKNWKRVIEILVIGLGGFLVNYFMKLSFHRIRPTHPLIDPLQNFSFPSGHATSGFIFYGLIAYLVWKTNIPKMYKYFIGSIFVLFSLLIGFSRVYLRMHYPSDVIAGFCIGFAWLILIILLFERLKQKSNSEIQFQTPIGLDDKKYQKGKNSDYGSEGFRFES